MKIGILTLPLHTNYGGILQAYALQTTLERLGHEVHVITLNYSAQTFPLHKVCYIFTRRVIGSVIRRRRYAYYNINKESKYYSEIYEAKASLINRFICRYIHRHLYRVLSKDVHQSDFNGYVVGSDQIWRLRYIQGCFNTYDAFLDFAKNWNVRRIAYAASFGIDKWEFDEESTDRIQFLLRLFAAISVREKSGVELCNQYLDINAKHVLDPTLLLEKEQYEYIIQQSDIPIPKQSNILTHYVLDQNEDLTLLIKKVAVEKRLTPFSLDLCNSSSKQSTPLPSIEQWLAAFRDASFVITDSFHACVFSIIFRKPFIVIGNKSRGYSRFISLLQTFGLEGNLITSVDDYNPTKSYEVSDTVYDKLFELKKDSIQFLKTHLS